MANEKRVNCPMRHENGNCLPCGGFCTAVNDSICEALHNAFRHGQSEQYERLALSIMKENAKHEQEKLEELRKIYKKVTSPTVEVCVQKIIAYIDTAFEREHGDSYWIDEQGEKHSADVGYGGDWWENCMKPELLRVFGERGAK